MEIERKFLINKFPDLNCEKTIEIYQGYISINPEVRIRSYKYNNNIDYKLTIKGSGDLSRKEIETYIDKDVYDGISEMIKYPLIHKLYKKYCISDGLILECSHVDIGLDSEFMYAEIEFDNEKQALEFIVPDYLGKEVTYDPSYKMKNYWKHTRIV